MWVKRLATFLFVLFFAMCLTSQDVEATQGLTTISSAINNKLLDLKKNSAIVTEQLKMVSKDLKLSQQEANQWKEQSMKLSNSLQSINEELNNSYESIIWYEKLLKYLIIFFLINTAGKLVGFALYLKGIPIPRWLDILL